MTIPTLKLNNGVDIPQLGFGVFKIAPEEAVEVIGAALDVGYRHIDTAAQYGNEKEVGEAIARSGLDRSEIFVTSKLANSQRGFDAALSAFDQTMANLGFDQLDLYLIHWPLPTVRDYVETWRALERIYSEGRVRSIGVSNFQIPHLERMFGETEVVPVVNQIEAHPYFTQEALLEFDADHDIATQAWSPIGRGRVLDDPVIADLASEFGKTSAQIVLRWHIQRGSIIFPKSSHRERMRENLDIFDFALTEEQMAKISGLNRNERFGPDPDIFDGVPRR